MIITDPLAKPSTEFNTAVQFTHCLSEEKTAYVLDFRHKVHNKLTFYFSFRPREDGG
jgi:hypothetical protein